MASQPRPEPTGGTEGFSLAAAVAAARAGDALATTGVVRGHVDGVHWLIVDPARHPLTVWEGVPTRARIGALRAVVATNGPMMGRRIAGRWKVTRSVLALVPTAAGAVVGAGAVRRGRTRSGAVAGAITGFATVAALLARWEPCGVVRSARGIDDRRDFDGEGVDHAWIGRAATGPPLVIGDGALPDAMVEGCGGLVRLVRDGAICRGGDAARLATRRGVAACGVLAGEGAEPGVALVVGSPRIDVAGAAVLLHAAGARDAVASDPSGCAFLATGTELLVGPPRWARRRIQRYGLAFGAA